MSHRTKHRHARRPIGAGPPTTDRTTGAAVAAKTAAKAHHRVLPVIDFLDSPDVAFADRAIAMERRRKRNPR